MGSRLENITARISELYRELDAEMDQRRAAFGQTLHDGRVRFDRRTKERHRALRMHLGAFLRRTRPMTVITAPVIYSLIIPFVLLDIFVSVFQTICFPVYGIPKVPRRDYIRYDRHKLQYLNALQKLNCLYCGYCNGLIAWVREIASRTEAFWCPIKHAARIADPHGQYPHFAEFGDAEGFQPGLEAARRRVTGKTG